MCVCVLFVYVCSILVFELVQTKQTIPGDIETVIRHILRDDKKKCEDTKWLKQLPLYAVEIKGGVK